MTSLQDIRRRLCDRVGQPVAPADNDIDVVATLGNLLHADTWTDEHGRNVDRLSRKLDTTRRIDAIYGTRWRRVSSTQISADWRCVAAWIMCQALRNEMQHNPVNVKVLKRLNVACKAVDYVEAIAPDDAAPLRLALDQQAPAWTSIETAASAPARQENPDRKTVLPLTVLFSEGPIARAYLETIASLGLRPRKIIQLVSAVDIATGKPTFAWLPRALRTPVAASFQRSRIFHWPSLLTKRYPEVTNAILQSVAESFEFEERILRDALVNKPLLAYSDVVETQLVENLKDPALRRRLQQETNKEFLYTGGGILPADLLDIADSRFIHIHPGYLPDIRGADGLLWSVLCHGRPSASAFYMAPGIDTGDILMARWLPKVQVAIDTDIDVLTHYRLAYALVDPWVRCRVLRELVTNHAAFSGINAAAQDEADGMTYHFMHDRLRRMALDKLLVPRL